METLKPQLDTALSNPLWLILALSRRVGPDGLQRFLAAPAMLYMNDIKCSDRSLVQQPCRTRGLGLRIWGAGNVWDKTGLLSAFAKYVLLDFLTTSTF